MSEAPTNPTKDLDKVKERVKLAVGIVAGSQKIVGVAKAMELVGFSTEEIKTMKFYQQVCRKAMKLCVVKKEGAAPTPLPQAVNVAATAPSTASSLTNESLSKFRRNHGRSMSSCSSQGCC
jgi:hypothetical protein